MSTATISSRIQRETELFGQTIVVIGGSAGIGFETARCARSEGAKVILTARNAERLQRAAGELDALSSAAFDAPDPVALDGFFRDLPTIDHVMVTAGRPYYGRLADMDFMKIAISSASTSCRRFTSRAARPTKCGREATLIFMGGTGGRRPAIGMSIAGAVTAALPALTADLALEIAPVRVNLIAAGIRGHASVRGTAGRSARKTSEPASRHASHPTRGRTGGCSRARRAHYDQYRPHRRNLCHRRRTAVRRRLKKPV